MKGQDAVSANQALPMRVKEEKDFLISVLLYTYPKLVFIKWEASKIHPIVFNSPVTLHTITRHRAKVIFSIKINEKIRGNRLLCQPNIAEIKTQPTQI
ncbi:hypothetical protein [Shimazuella kribbensis]|uniref:hypothetical protein n=1 Tax=Shimazuella kribbensis TaxID=139808 RepID=UPI0012EC3097|nr:hypothetical protein [Shimazuella kribbensis]